MARRLFQSSLEAGSKVSGAQVLSPGAKPDTPDTGLLVLTFVELSGEPIEPWPK